MLKYIVLALVSFGASLVLTRLVRAFAIRIGAVDQPGGRKIHAVAVPRLGGVSVFLSIAIAIVASFGLEYIGGSTIPIDRRAWVPILCGTAIVFFVGVWDDLRSLPAWLKFLFQTLAAGVVIWFGIYVEPISSLERGPFNLLNMLAVPLAFLWIVGVTNAFNLVDGLDGLATGLGIIAAGTSATIFIMRGDTSDALLLIILLAALSGFLFYNFNPATIFLGDSGSLVIGYLLAATAVVGSQKQATALGVVIPLLVFGLPIIDTLLSMLRRFIGGIKVVQPYRRSVLTRIRSFNQMFEPDRSHIHHRLLAMGLSHRNVVLIFYGLSLSLALLVLVSVLAQYRNAGIIIIAVALVTYIGIHKLGYDEATLFRAGSVLRWYEGLTFDRRFFLGFIDVLLIAAAYWGAFVLKYNLAWSSAQKHWYLTTFPLVILIQLATFFVFNLYRGVWRAIGIGDLINISMAVATGAFLSYVLAVINAPPTDGTITYFVIYLMLLGTVIVSSRSAYRILSYIRQREQSGCGKALIYGAGHHGQIVLRELSNNSGLRLQPVGFIDDDSTLIGRRVDRLPVLGSGKDLASLLAKRQITTLILAASNVEEGRLSRVISVCHEHRIAVLRCNMSIEPIGNGATIDGDKIYRPATGL